MKDFVIAVYRKETYAGETILKLEEVFYRQPIPEKYNSCEYKFKIMQLEEFTVEG